MELEKYADWASIVAVAAIVHVLHVKLLFPNSGFFKYKLSPNTVSEIDAPVPSGPILHCSSDVILHCSSDVDTNGYGVMTST